MAYRRTFGKFRKSNGGTSALEFAMLAPAMVALIVSSLETGLIATRITLLENAMTRVARMVYVGTVSSGGLTKDQIEEYICGRIDAFTSDCAGNLNVEITPITDLDDIPADEAECKDTNVEIEPTVKFNPGGGTMTMYIRACLTMDIIVPGLGIGLNLQQSDSGRYQTVAAVAFQNEPF